MTNPRLLWLSLLLMGSTGAFAQPDLCCIDATCLTPEEVDFCVSASGPLSDPANAYSGGTFSCGVNLPFGPLCTSFCENNPFGFCVACLDPNACNYGVSADLADECSYPEFGYDCDGECLADVNANGICDAFETFGCLDEAACNFNPDADADSGNCTYALEEYDCNGNCLDDDGDGVCNFNEILGCTDSLALNHYPFVTEDDGTCIYLSDFESGAPPTPGCPGDLNGNGLVDVADLTFMLSAIGIFCTP